MKLVFQLIVEHRGLALTEYLILLALLTSGVIAAVLIIGGNLETVWSAWANFFADLEEAQPDLGS